jgi:shikimate dehydrogenase
MRRYGLIGKSLSHSFSPSYFENKFEGLGINDATYSIFELPEIEDVKALLDEGLDGFNVTIPYKQSIINYLDDIDNAAKAIGAVNCVKKTNKGYVGYNTDWIGFRDSLMAMLARQKIESALVLGDGGASKGVCYALKSMGILYKKVSRNEEHISYRSVTNAMVRNHLLIVNTTSLGMYPFVNEKPDIPYDALTSNHFLFDVIYNPEQTLFLEEGLKRQCSIKNGYEMLKLQADASWEIWTKE